MDGICQKVFILLFEKASWACQGNGYSPLFAVVERVAVENFFTEGADELLDDKIHKLVEY